MGLAAALRRYLRGGRYPRGRHRGVGDGGHETRATRLGDPACSRAPLGNEELGGSSARGDPSRVGAPAGLTVRQRFFRIFSKLSSCATRQHYRRRLEEPTEMTFVKNAPRGEKQGRGRTPLSSAFGPNRSLTVRRSFVDSRNGARTRPGRGLRVV